MKLLLVVGLAALLLPGTKISFAQAEDFRVFPETGHRVSGAFLEFYNAVPNAEFYFGYPISREFTDSLTGRRMQYFQRVRFEYYPDGKELGERVQLTDLGNLLYDETRGQDLSLPPNSRSCEVIEPIEEFQVCYSFLEFYRAHNGESPFGFPISNARKEDGRIVQYFTRAKFSFHPEAPPGQRVELSDLGRIYFYQHLENLQLMEPEKDNISTVILDIKVRVFPEKALVGPGESQLVYVVVQDQNLKPVAKAGVTLTTWSESGKINANHLLPSTDENGITQVVLPGNEEIEVVQIDATAFQNTATTSYRIWW